MESEILSGCASGTETRSFVEASRLDMAIHRERSVVDMLREKARTQPHLPAVRDGELVLTYGELDAMSDTVACDLQQRGLVMEEPVAVLIPASSDYVVAMLGILKAGGAYLPIDPEAPEKRLEFMLQDSGSRFVLTNAEGRKRLADWPGKALEVAQIIREAGRPSGQNARVTSDPKRRAYIIYTSGSTGQPKGVEIEHHSLTNLVCAYFERFQLTPRDRSTLFANVAFDISVADVWPTLCAGGSVMVPPQEVFLNPDGLIAWLAAEQITWTFVPTGLAEILFARPWPAQMALRILMTGGDRLRARPAGNLPFIVLNGYGPTENTVVSTWSLVKAQNGDAKLPAIGKPLGNVKAYVLDEFRQPVGDGKPGELYLGGEQVARGYLGKADLTAAHFLPDSFTGRAGDRMYSTGDWVRRRADGELDFLGRRDDQVQIRGSRVELGEIEAALLTHSAVRQACCLPRTDNGVATGVVAHVVPAGDEGDISAALQLHLAAHLPVYMLPSQFIFHERLPLTSFGKVDRSALLKAQSRIAILPKTEENGDGLDMALWRLWHSLLPDAGNFPREAKFASLGGDSLLMVRLMLGVEEITNQRLECSTFLMQPTFPGLCQAVRTRMLQTEFQPVLALRKQGTRPPLFCVYLAAGDIDGYFDLAESLGDDQPVYGIRCPALEDPTLLPNSMEAAAAEVVRCIRKVQPRGAPALLGYSWANLLAFEVSRQFAENEGISCFTALIGGDAPLLPANFAARLAHFAGNLPGWLFEVAREKRKWQQRFATWRHKLAHGNVKKIHLPIFSSPISSHMIDLMERYQPPPGSMVPVDLFRDRESYLAHPHPLRIWELNRLPDAGWTHFTGGRVKVHWQEGDHHSIIRPPLASGLARSVLQAMDEHILEFSNSADGGQKQKCGQSVHDHIKPEIERSLLAQ